jgi:excisionase family DNA binding protein
MEAQINKSSSDPVGSEAAGKHPSQTRRQHFASYAGGTTDERGDLPVRMLAQGLLDIHQAAACLGCSPRYLRRLIQERRIPFVRLGGTKIRFSIRELDAWVDATRVEARR